MKSILNNTEKDQIAKAIAQAESKTSGEIVVFCARNSGTYRWVNAVLALVGIAIGSLVFFLLPYEHTTFDLIAWQCIGMVVFLLSGLFAPVRRAFIRSHEKSARVHTQAVQYFVHKGITNTRDRTGVLVYLSEFERRVEIIADQGIHKTVPKDFWKEQVEHIIEGIRQRKASESICTAVADIGLKLSEKFPRKKDDKNELADRPE